MYHRGGGNPNEGGFNNDHPDDEINMMETTDSADPTPPPIHRSSNHPLGASSSSVQQQQHMTSSLASKPHAFGGAVLSPDHARNLTTDLVLQLSSALSVQASHAASSRGILPPNNRSGTTGENINLFKGSDLVNVLTGGWGLQQAAQTNVAGGGGGGASGVFRTATTTPGTPNNNNKSNTNQSSSSLPPHILQLLQTGGLSSSNASVTGGGLGGTSKIFSTPGTSTPGSTTTASIPNSPMNTPIIDHQQQLNNNNININPLSLLSTSEALESFTSWRTHYTTWITEAWNILKWSEPSAALFWEMATMFHTLYVASLSVRGGGSGAVVRERVLGGNSSSSLGGGGNASVSGGSSVASGSGSGTAAVMKRQVLMTPSSTSNYIPPLLSCGSQSSMGSVRSVDPLSVSANERKEGGQDIFNNNKIVQSPHATNASSSSRSGGGGAMKPARHSAKELPVWLISMFLLVHCEMEAFLRCTSGEDERRFLDGSSSASMSPTGEASGSTDGGGGSSLDFSALLHHRALSPRTRLHAGTHQNNANCASFLLRHLRKFILLCAVPRNVAACKAIASLAARSSSSSNDASNAGNRSNVHRYSGTGSNIDIASIDKQHEAEHGSIGLDIELTVEELDRLHLVLQAPSGGLVDEPPIAIGEHVLKCLALEEIEAREGKPSNTPPSHRWNLMQNGLITVADAERVLRRYLEEELTMAKAELDGDDNQHDGVTPTSEDVASKLSKLSIGQQQGSDAVSSSRITPIQPLSPRSRGVSIAESTDADGNKDSSSYLKELSYQKLRSTTVLLEPGNATSDTHNDTDGNSSAASLDQHSQASSTRSHQGGSGKAAATNESGRLHDLHVADCSDTHFYLLQPFEHATIAACTDCTIVLGAVAGILHVVDCERTTITSAARRVVVSNSFDVVHYLFTPSPPLLVGDNRGCQFAPYNTYYEGLRDDLLATGLAAVLRSASSAGSSSGSVTGDTTASPGRGYGGDVGGRTSPTSTAPTLQCASNKWKSPVELCKIEVPQLPNVQTPGSPSLESSGSLSPGADDRALGGSVDTTMKTPVLLPSSEFDVLLVPVESEEARVQRQMMRESQEAEAAAAAANANNEEENPVSEGGEEDEVGETTTVYSTTSSLTGVTGERKGGGQKPQPESDYCRILADLLTFSPFHMPHDYERRVIAKAERVRGLQQAMQELNDEQRTSLQDELNRGFQDWLVTSGNLRQVLDLIHLEKGVAA